jgi:hypothetical protein
MLTIALMTGIATLLFSAAFILSTPPTIPR